MKKKLVSLMLIGMMVAGMSTTAMAADDTLTEEKLVTNPTKAVTATYEPGVAAQDVYNVDITWGTMKFTYKGASQGQWDPATLTYTGAKEAEWTCEQDANVITIDNNSNVAVNVTVSATDVIEGLKYKFDNETENTAKALTISKATAGTDGQNGTPSTQTVTLNITGGSIDKETTIANLTVTLNK